MENASKERKGGAEKWTENKRKALVAQAAKSKRITQIFAVADISWPGLAAPMLLDQQIPHSSRSCRVTLCATQRYIIDLPPAMSFKRTFDMGTFTKRA